MRLLTQKGPTCLIYSTAMVTGLEPEWIISRLGHDGTAMVGGNMRGVHIQEILDVVLSVGIWLYPIKAMPFFQYSDGSELSVYSDPIARFMERIRDRNAILLGEDHAMAWCGMDRMVYDPNGRITEIADCGMRIREAWICQTV